MAIKDINELKGKFADDKEPNGADFGDFMDSFYHRSTRISQNNILGLVETLDNKADRSDFQNLSVGIKDYHDDVQTIAERDAIANPYEGLAVAVINDKDANGNSYIHLYNGTTWKRTPITIMPKDILSKSELIKSRSWLKNKDTLYTKIELGVISQIFDIKLYDSEISDGDIYTITEFYVKDGYGIIHIHKNGKSWVRRSLLDITAQRYSADKIDIYYDFSIPTSGNLNSSASQIIISPSCVSYPISEKALKELTYQFTDITLDIYGIVKTAKVVWSDGSGGEYYAGDFNSLFLCYDSYRVYHFDSGYRMVQPAVTRNEMGVIVTQPQIVIEKTVNVE